jgi:hypothetical protein
VDCGTSSAGFDVTISDKLVSDMWMNIKAATRAEATSQGINKVEANASIRTAMNAALSTKLYDEFKLHGAAWCTSTPKGPGISASAEACVQQGQSNGVVNGLVVNNDTVAHDANVTIDAKDVAPVTVNQVPGNGGSKPFSFSGLAPGQFTVTATMAGQTISVPVTVGQCQSQPPTAFITQKNDVDVNDTFTATLNGTIPDAHAASVLVTCHFGSITTSQTFTVNGQYNSTIGYKAPSEVPLGDNQVQPGYDRIDVVVTDKVTGLQASVSTTFKVNPSPTPPL